MEVKNLTCIGCPMGCAIEVKLEDGKILSVTGNTCAKGDIYARKEVTNPTRIVTSSVSVNGGDMGLVSVKTAHDVPKGRVFDVVRALKGVTVDAPVHIGDVIIKDVLGLGVDVVATRNVERA